MARKSGENCQDVGEIAPLEKAQLDAQLLRVEQTIRDRDSMLIAWLTRKFGDPEVARDIAQDAYLRVWRYAHRKEVQNPQALLFKTAANLTANEFRARRKVQIAHVVSSQQDDEPDLIQNVPSDAPSQERVSTAKQEVEISMEAISALPEKVRRAFVMSRFQEMSYTQIAKEMGVSVSSVEKYIITALSALRKVLENNSKVSANVIPLKIEKSS